MQEAKNRKLSDWHHKIKHGEIKLPPLQRFEAWDSGRIRGLIETIIRDLPNRRWFWRSAMRKNLSPAP